MSKYTFQSPFLKRIYIRDDKDIGEDYPFSTQIFQKGIDLPFLKPLTILVGENGSGKSTLLELIAAHCGFNLSGGNRNHVYEEEKSYVESALDVLRFSWNKRIGQGFFLRAESFFNFSSYIDELQKEDILSFAPYGGTSLHEQSHGEAFLSLFANKFSEGIYILDEPEAALSPQRQLALIAILSEMAESGKAQIIMATHSPLLMAIPGAELLSIEDGEFREKSYKATQHFQIMSRFMDDPERYMERFLSEDL